MSFWPTEHGSTSMSDLIPNTPDQSRVSRKIIIEDKGGLMIEERSVELRLKREQMEWEAMGERAIDSSTPCTGEWLKVFALPREVMIAGEVA